MSDCLFCKIIAGEIPCDKVYEDETILAFRDINPQAPVHILLVPKAHIASSYEVTSQNCQVVGHIFEIISQLAEHEGLHNGYRVVTNCGADGCQSVHHLHFHLMGGKKLSEQMG
ncbi:MAG: histidine triad nucleotide-binding protein [Oscillospiraceae bacterium]|nr:histidine triad nucleotide-binding protein [Oscillospiraceae bacterium]